jgi:S1-C subfamily serine protease
VATTCLALGALVPTTVALAHGAGHVEIEPSVLEREVHRAALARAKLAAVPTSPVPAAAQLAAPLPAYSLLADGTTHDAGSLMTRARSLVSAGYDVTIAFVDVAPEAVARVRQGSGASMSVVPVYVGNVMSGLQIASMSADSPVRPLGIEAGDVLLSLNGFRMNENLEAFYETSFVRNRGGNVVVELLRSGKRIVLDLWWSGSY